MDTEQVVKKILSDADSEAEVIKKQADEKAAGERAEFAEQQNEYKKQTQALAQKAAEDKRLHILAAARMEIVKQLLAEKRKVLDDIFTRARQQLKDLPDEQYQDLMAKLMSAAVETGDEEVIVDRNEKRIDSEFIRQVNSKLGPDHKGGLKLSGEKQNIEGGFILKRGRIKNNLSLSVLLAQARKEIEIELAKELFGSTK